ncbi:MAG: L-fuculokinase [Christensenellales bacterium]
MALIGIDIGSTGCKAVSFTDGGKKIMREYVEYNIARTGMEHVLSAKSIFDGIRTILAETAKKINEPIEAISVSSFGESFIPLAENGEALDDIMLYSDSRGEAEATYLGEHVSDITYITGLQAHRMFSLPKIMWLKNNKPKIFDRTSKFMFMATLVIYMLSGECVIDYPLATRTLAFDIRKLDWSDEILDVAGVSEKKMPKCVPPGYIVGNIRADVAADLGLSPNTKIVAGAHDQIVAALGSGVLESGEACNGMGTVECITPIFDGIITDKEVQKNAYCCVPFVTEGKYATYAFNYTGGALLKWFRDNIYDAIKGSVDSETFYREYDDTLDDKPTDLLISPYFSGAATPYMDGNAKGAILGLTLATTPKDIYKALMESVCYESLRNVEILGKTGIKLNKLIASGGGANSKPWVQIKSDILGVPIEVLDNNEAGTAGSAMLAAMALGKYSSLKDAVKNFCKIKRVVEPNTKYRDFYREQFQRYVRIYEQTKDI